MSDGNEKKVKVTAFRMSFLMEHQRIMPELFDLAEHLHPEIGSDQINTESPEYLKGAFDALTTLIAALQQKGIAVK